MIVGDFIKDPSAAFAWPVRVYYEDTDAGGVVYYANYLKFFERGRSEALRALGFEQDQLSAEADTIFAVRQVTVDYHAPARFNDMLTIVTSIQQLGKASICFHQTAQRANQAQILATALVKVACIKAATLKPRPIPPSIMQALKAHAG